MQVKLTPLKTFDLEINGIVFKDMKQTNQMDGVIELKGNGHFATLVDTRNNFAQRLDSIMGDDGESWQVVRGTTEIIRAAKLSDVKNDHPTATKESTVLRSDFDLCMQDKNRCITLIEDVHALLCAGKDTHAKELLEKRVNNQTVDIPPFIFNRQHKPA